MSIRIIAFFFLATLFALNGGGQFIAEANGENVASAARVAEKYVRTELYFGLGRKGGPDIGQAEFQAFIDEFVTPRFPKGLTVLDAQGQWLEDGGTTTKELAKVLVIFYHRNDRRATNLKIEEIRNEYKKRFSQQSVLRLDITKGIKVDF